MIESRCLMYYVSGIYPSLAPRAPLRSPVLTHHLQILTG